MLLVIRVILFFFSQDANGVKGAVPRVLWQMCLRFRSVTDAAIDALVRDTPMTDQPDLYEKILNGLGRYKTLLKRQYGDLLQFDPEYTEGDIKLSPDYVTRLVAYTVTEGEEDVPFAVVRNARRHGANIVWEKEENSKSRRLADGVARYRAHEADMVRYVHAEMKMDELSAVISQSNVLVHQQKADSLTRERGACAKILIRWPERKLTLKEYTLARANMHRVTVLALILKKVDPQHVLRYDLNLTIKLDWMDLQRAPYSLVFSLLTTLLGHLGIDSIFTAVSNQSDLFKISDRDAPALSGVCTKIQTIQRTMHKQSTAKNSSETNRKQHP